MDEKRVIELSIIANRVRKNALTAVHSAQSGHPGGSLSIADVLTLLYFEVMKNDPKNPKDPDRDRFVLSKGHTAPALYGTLAERGYFPVEDIPGFRHIDSYLQGHPDMVRFRELICQQARLDREYAWAQAWLLPESLIKRITEYIQY